jgi:hypothetical protein
VCWKCGRTDHLRRDCPQRPAKDAADKHNWRTDGAAEARYNASRQVATSTRTPRVILLPDEKRQVKACNATLEKQIKELKAKMALLEAALDRTMKATTVAPKEEDSEAEI